MTFDVMGMPGNGAISYQEATSVNKVVLGLGGCIVVVVEDVDQSGPAVAGQSYAALGDAMEFG